MKDGRTLLGDFLTRNGLTQTAGATAIGVSLPTVHDWLTGRKRPRQHHRQAIAIWTHGEVPAESWASSDERAKVGAVQPFVPSDGSGEHHAVEPANDDDELAPEDRDASNDDDAA